MRLTRNMRLWLQADRTREEGAPVQSVIAASHAFIPYIRSETYYYSRRIKWRATAVCAGPIFPFKTHFQPEPSFQHINDTGGTRNQQVETFGMTLSLYF